MNHTRRNLLKALGLVGPSYFASSLGSRRSARAADPTIPTRILFFYTPHGTLLRQWVSPPSGATAPTETSFELGPILKPLQPFKSNLVLLEGLDFQSGYVDPLGTPSDHEGGQAHSLSATNRASAKTAGGISIDQLIAKQINAPSPVTALPSLELSARNAGSGATFNTSWSGSGALVPPISDPAVAYKRLFPNGPPTSSQPSAAQMAAAAAGRRQKSILDGVLSEFNAVKQPLSSADKAKLDSHAALIRDLEARQQLGTGSTPGATCSAPTQSAITSPYMADCPQGSGTNCLKDATTAFTSLAVAALACDLTRVITLDVDQMASSMFGVSDIHTFLHSMDDLDWYSNDHFGTKNSISATAMDAGNIQIGVKFFAAYAQLMADLLQKLSAVPEPDGSTLLDHTIVVWCGEIGSTNHTDFMVNYVLAGGGGVPFKTGRYLKLPRTQPKTSRDYYATAGLPHNNLFVSLANAVGLTNVTTFGNSSVCTGPLTQLKG